jgi:hypothetical protein
MAVINGIPLAATYSMGVVAGRARCVLVDNMFFVLFETIVTQDAVPVMAFIA